MLLPLNALYGEKHTIKPSLVPNHSSPSWSNTAAGTEVLGRFPLPGPRVNRRVEVLDPET